VPACSCMLLHSLPSCPLALAPCLRSCSASSWRSNYFYRCCLTGRFSKNCCPRFLEEPCFNKLKVRGARHAPAAPCNLHGTPSDSSLPGPGGGAAWGGGWTCKSTCDSLFPVLGKLPPVSLVSLAYAKGQGVALHAPSHRQARRVLWGTERGCLLSPLQHELAARNCMRIATSFFVEELRSRMYTKVSSPGTPRGAAQVHQGEQPGYTKGSSPGTPMGAARVHQGEQPGYTKGSSPE